MLVHTDRSPVEVNPATLAPLCDEAEFAELIAELVAEETPRLFAVVQEYGERADGRIAAWGLAFENHVEVIGVDHGGHATLRSPERAARVFRRRPHITARLVWVNPAAPIRSEGDEAACLVPAVEASELATRDQASLGFSSVVGRQIHAGCRRDGGEEVVSR